MFEALEICELRWPRSGKINCPSHSDSSPSLHVYSDERGFYCFSCGATGDAYGLLSLLQGVHVNTVLRRYGGAREARPKKETIQRVGVQALEARLRTTWSAMNKRVFERLHEVFGKYEDDFLVDQIVEMGEFLDDTLDQILGHGEYADVGPLPIIEAQQLIQDTEEEQMTWLWNRKFRLTTGRAWKEFA